MSRFFKILILACSAVIAFSLLLEARRENLGMEWQRHQRRYKQELAYRAQSEQDRATAEEYEIRLRQIVLPHLSRADRCVTCHAGIEDTRMGAMPNPLKAHPGDYLQTHDPNVVGCTSCHDGQGRAVTAAEAHATGTYKYWEQPILKGPFVESSCARCHAGNVAGADVYNEGKAIFARSGCLGCHTVAGKGGVIGPDLTAIGEASFHVKAPVAGNRERLLDQFEGNVNLAYLHEALTQPRAQPEDSSMPKPDLSEEETTALLVYLKSLSGRRRLMDIGAETAEAAIAAQPRARAASAPASGGSEGARVFAANCSACHTVGRGDGVGPDLEGVVSRRDAAWLTRFIKTPSEVIAEKDPAVMELLARFRTPMPDLGLSDAQVAAVIDYLKDPQAADAAQASVEPPGDSAPPAQLAGRSEKGRALFQGKQRFLNRGPACMSCHSVRNADVFAGGSLARDLTQSYSRLGEAGVKNLLLRPPFPAMRAAYAQRPLTEDEAAALGAFLADIEARQGNQPAKSYGLQLVLSGMAGLFAMLGGLGWIARKRKPGPVNKSIYERQARSE